MEKIGTGDERESAVRNIVLSKDLKKGQKIGFFQVRRQIIKGVECWDEEGMLVLNENSFLEEE